MKQVPVKIMSNLCEMEKDSVEIVHKKKIQHARKVKGKWEK